MISHKFDQMELGARTKKWRKDDIHFGNAPLRGLLPLRYLYYRTNEGKIPAEIRMGFKWFTAYQSFINTRNFINVYLINNKGS